MKTLTFTFEYREEDRPCLFVALGYAIASATGPELAHARDLLLKLAAAASRAVPKEDPQ